MIVRGWKGTLLYWLYVADAVAWLAVMGAVLYILLKYAKWAA